MESAHDIMVKAEVVQAAMKFGKSHTHDEDVTYQRHTLEGGCHKLVSRVLTNIFSAISYRIQQGREQPIRKRCPDM